MRSDIRFLLIAPFVFSGLLIQSCNFKKEKNTASLSIAVNFPAKKLSAQYLRPETQCIEIFLKSKDENFSKTVILTPQNNSVTIKNLKPQTILISARLTDGPQSPDGCTGFDLDYISAIVKVEPGANTANLPLPGAQWSLGQSISLNGTLNSSQESINSFVILQHPKSLKSGAFDFYTLFIKGQNLNNCNSGTGVACSVKTQYSVAGQGKSSKAILGNEFVPFPDYQYGFIPLSPDASNNERYFAIVGVPPCTYFKNQDLVKCSFTSSTDLTQYMGAEVSNDVLNGYIWEVRVLTKSSGVRCAWDQNFAQTFTCPSSLTEPPPQPGSASPQVKSAGSPKLKAAQLIQNISSTLEKIYKLQSLNYASCDPNNPEVCDYNLNGTIGDAGDDTNGDGVINLSDNRTFYSEFSWSMTFDLFPHPFTSSPGYPQTLPSSVFAFTEITDTLSLNSAIYLHDISLNTTVQTIGSKTGPQDTDMELILWQFGSLDFTDLYYTGLHPRFLVFRKAGIVQKLDLYNPTAGTTVIYDEVATNQSICDFRLITDPLAGKGYFFVYTSSPGTCLTPTTPNPRIIDTDGNQGNHNFIDSTNFLLEPAIYSNTNTRWIEGVIGLNPVTGNLERCDLTAPPFSCIQITRTPDPFTTPPPSEFYPAGFYPTNKYSFFVVGDGTNSYLFYSTMADRNIAYLESSQTPVDVCTAMQDTVYCGRVSTSGLLSIYKFDFSTNSLALLNSLTLSLTSPFITLLDSTSNYVIVEITDQVGNTYYYAFPKSGANPLAINLPASVNSISIEHSNDTLILGRDPSTNMMCYLKETDIQNFQCIQNSYLAYGSFDPSFYITTPASYLSMGTLLNYSQNYKWIPVSEGCTPQPPNCTGGTLVLYSLDLNKKITIGPVPSGFQPKQVFGIDGLLYIKMYDPVTPQSEIYIVNATSKTLQPTGITGTDVGIVSDFPRFVYPP